MVVTRVLLFAQQAKKFVAGFTKAMPPSKMASAIPGGASFSTILRSLGGSSSDRAKYNEFNTQRCFHLLCMRCCCVGVCMFFVTRCVPVRCGKQEEDSKTDGNSKPECAWAGLRRCDFTKRAGNVSFFFA